MTQPRQGSMPPAAILGGILNARSAARTLRRYGVAVHLFPDRGSASQAGPVGPERWLEHLDASPSSLEGAVLVPCSDDALEFVAQHRARLAEAGYRPVTANDQGVWDMLNKARTYELAVEAGVPVPTTMVVSSVEDLRVAAQEFGFPCALKPVFSHRFQRHFPIKAFVVHSPSELEARYRDIVPTGAEMLLTEIVRDGHDEYCSYYAYLEQDGTPIVSLTKRKLRQNPIGFGMGTLHVTSWEPDAAKLGLRFARAAGLLGLVNVEFKRDARDGVLKLIECNARLTAANELVRRAGVDFARIAYDRTLGRPSLLPQTFSPDVYEWHPVGDFQAFRQYRANGDLTTAQWLRSLMHPRLGLPASDLPTVLAGGAQLGRTAIDAVLRRNVSGGAAALSNGG